MSIKRRLAVTRDAIAKQYQSMPSFLDKLPWCDWSEEKNILLLEDRCSVGAALELQDVAMEAASPARVATLHKKLTQLLSTVIPLCDENPWVCQFFIQDEFTLDPVYQRLETYLEEKNTLADPFVQRYLSIYRHHFDQLTREEGVFHDPMSGLPFRGRMRRIRLVFYRRYASSEDAARVNGVDELNETAESLISRLQQAGIRVRRLTGAHLYEWWVRWFNPQNEKKLLKQFPYPKQKKPFGWSFSQNIFFHPIASTATSWVFDELHHKLLLFQDLQQPVPVGAMSRERAWGNGEQQYALLDKLPVGSIYTIQVVFESKRAIHQHLNALEKAAVGKGERLKTIVDNIQRARFEVEDNQNHLFRAVEGIYVRGKDEAALTQIETQLNALLMDSGLILQSSKTELYPLDAYLRLLPFNFNVQFDKKYAYRSSYQYADDVARLLPLYGRARGDGMHPLFLFYNRGGEAFIFDHLHKHFKMANSHMAIIGTTGAGKSVTLNQFCMSLSAVYRPHIIVIEVGGSFDLTAQYFAAHGRSVGVMKFDRQKPLAMNPYAEAYQALAFIEQEEADCERADRLSVRHAEKIQEEMHAQKILPTDQEMACEEDRDILNEMLLATRMMITRGDPKEEAKLDLTDMTCMNRGLIAAMKHCKAIGVKQMRVSHVAEMFDRLAKAEENEKCRTRFIEFAMRLHYFVQDSVRAKFINRESPPLGNYDFLHIDFGFMQHETYADLLNISCIAILSKILALAEANKASGRPTCLILDEVHVLLKCPMLAVSLILMAKVARKIGLWLTVCTNNIHDFAGIEARKVLSMMETWLCLALDREEVRLLEQFKPLTDEMRDLVMDIRKYPGVYSEGVLLGKRFTGLFRNVPPRVSLSLAMTEQDERTERKRLQQEKGLTELEAVDYMARELETVQPRLLSEDFFL